SLDIIEDTRSELALERISKWLSHCIENYESCKPPDPSYIPRRLIHVGSFGKEEPSLVEPSKPVLYLCLSYCWGPDTKDVLVTTAANLASHYKAIPLATVPATIRDAISICRGLGFSYLWVDALCIIQGDQKEWLKDSAQMREIYSNSHLTLSAVEPASCKLGFLGKQSFGGCEWQRPVETDVPVQVINGHCVYPREGEWIFSLDKRGWCLQESILPRRRLLLNGSEMLWQCQQEKYCECGHVYLAEDVKNKSRMVSTSHSEFFDQYARPKSYEHWRALVEEYSDRYLTQKTDKLSAISGLAKEFSEEHGWLKAEGTYKLYRGDAEFVYDLAWVAITSKDRIRIPEIKQTPRYIAPSWSWASVDGSIRYQFQEPLFSWKHDPVETLNCSVEEVICKSMTESDQTSPVVEGYAIMSGPIIPVELINIDQ
ncbi:heterokaryon incompatibility protein-domain-containing protein, partial [Hyaloscypha sp. PMI_1271]